MNSLLLIVFMLLSTSLFATYSTDWIKPADSYLKTGAMIAKDKFDNIVVVGSMTTQHMYTRKYDRFGNFLWERLDSSGIQSNYEKAVWVNTDKSSIAARRNDIYVVGYRYTGTSWDVPNAVIALKYNANGVLIWRQVVALSYVVGSSTGPRFNLRSEIDNNGNLYIACMSTTPGGVRLIRINSNGNLAFHTGGGLAASSSFITMRLSGNKIVVLGNAGLNGIPVMAWNTNGTALWSNSILGGGATDMEIEKNGNIYILSGGNNLFSATSGFDVTLNKLDANGNLKWRKFYDFGTADFPEKLALAGNRISATALSNLSAFDWVTFQMDTAGTKLWQAIYDGSTGTDQGLYYMIAKPNGDVFVTGKGGPSPSPFNLSYLRMITIKYNNTGATEWVDSLNYYNGWGKALVLGSDNSLYALSETNMTLYHFLDHTGTNSCNPPATINTTNVAGTSATVAWPTVPGASLYHLRYKTSTGLSWIVKSTNQNSLNINGLSPGTVYDYSVEAICSAGPTGYSATQQLTTTGTGYCTTGGQNALMEYLNLVWIGSIQNSTMSDNGYGDYTSLSTNLVRGSTVPGYLRATILGIADEFYRVWIDYNQNGTFTDPGELVAFTFSNSVGYNVINFTVPANAPLGTTRMRVTMQNGFYAAPCGSYADGETEDYTVQITSQSAPIRLSNTEVLQVYPNPFTDEITIQIDEVMNSTIDLYDIIGNKVLSFKKEEVNSKINLSYLKAGIYFVVVRDETGSVYTKKVVKQ